MDWKWLRAPNKILQSRSQTQPVSLFPLLLIWFESWGDSGIQGMLVKYEPRQCLGGWESVPMGSVPVKSVL